MYAAITLIAPVGLDTQINFQSIILTLTAMFEFSFFFFFFFLNIIHYVLFMLYYVLSPRLRSTTGLFNAKQHSLSASWLTLGTLWEKALSVIKRIIR